MRKIIYSSLTVLSPPIADVTVSGGIYLIVLMHLMKHKLDPFISSQRMFLKPTSINYLLVPPYYLVWLPHSCLPLCSTQDRCGHIGALRLTERHPHLSAVGQEKHKPVFVLDTTQTVVTQKLCILCCVYTHLNMQSTDWTEVSSVVRVVACLELISVTRQ